MKSPNEAVVTSKGQLVIPSKLRRACRIQRGTRVRFEQIPGGLAIYPKSEDSISRARGILAGLGLPAELERDDDHELR
jgi:AbrB family looped-hinge helix DNA binding protein